jgi:pantetheine-phosphate adenylyltransferase
MKQIIVGGTFEFLHDGHKELLRKAFSLGQVTIGLTSDEMANFSKKRQIIIFEERKTELEEFIKEEKANCAGIVKIEDIFGPSLCRNFDYIVVSPETYDTAIKINKEREKSMGRDPIKIIKIDFVLAEDGKPISSTRIYSGEIDKVGKLLK